jgi:hypothetical protein
VSAKSLEKWFQNLKVRFWLRWDLALLTEKGFFTWHKRPMRLRDWPRFFEARVLEESVGIVIQGPLVLKRDFTLETAKLYRAMYPDVQIVISTWAGVPKAFADACQRLGVVLVESNLIEDPLYGNLTRQQVTSLAGIDLLERSRIKFAVKLRTDQRLYSDSFLEQMFASTRMFPASKLPGRLSSHRIFLTYQNSFIDRSLSGSDFLQFGTTEDLCNFWKSLDDQIVSGEMAPEQILMGSYLRRCGWVEQDLFTRDSWDRAMRDVVGFIDSSSLDLFWAKYSSREFLWRRYGREPLREVTLRDWYKSMLDSGK